MNTISATTTPMMAQFLEIKEGYKDAILFYRMGDFYEMFFDDAVQAAQALDIALTKRGKHQGKDIPMCGVPVRAAENYLLSLIKKGFRVAVCEQMENPAEAKKRGSKSVVKRQVVRLVTPGTLTEDSLLNARKHNYLAAYAEVRDQAAFAWIDASTGDFNVMACQRVSLSPQLARFAPQEVLLSQTLESELRDLVIESGAAVTPLSRASFDSDSAIVRMTALFDVKSLDGFGQFGRAELSAMGAIVDYLDLTQKGKRLLIRPPKLEAVDRIMQIDAATRRNLELTTCLNGGREGSLLAVIDRTITGPGARMLDRRLNSPLLAVQDIDNRLGAVSFLKDDQTLCDSLRIILRSMPDMDRALSRLSLDRGTPRDLGAIRTGLMLAGDIQGALKTFDLPEILNVSVSTLSGFSEAADLLLGSLQTDLPMQVRDGGYVAQGFDSELDELRILRDEGRTIIASMQKQYSTSSGISSLKIKHNNVLGYFVETPSSHSEKMLNSPMSEVFIHRQTTANCVRFTTLELSELESKINSAGGRAQEIETRIFQELRISVLKIADKIAAAASTIAEIDLTAALADLARGEHWCRPEMSDDQTFDITGGRHPVVEFALKRTGEGPFVANDCDLSPELPKTARAWLLTGPNMAGKSTFLRQNALIALLAQIGSYVPADAARIGIVTQLFSRVGASDDLARGRSTFMVEMVETAAILNQAGPGALVILDEIGRGTATYDGLSIAWATLEHLHEVNKCRTLFATHYHELTSLSSSLAGLSNATVSVKEWEGEIIFLHEVHQGAADRSYGVQVAKLAGLPASVTARARQVLDELEKGDQRGKVNAFIDDLPLFSTNPAPVVEPSQAETTLKNVQPDDLTPIEALQLVYDLKALLN